MSSKGEYREGTDVVMWRGLEKSAFITIGNVRIQGVHILRFSDFQRMKQLSRAMYARNPNAPTVLFTTLEGLREAHAEVVKEQD